MYDETTINVVYFVILADKNIRACIFIYLPFTVIRITLKPLDRF